MMRLALVISFLLAVTHSFAAVEVESSVDRAHIGFGDTLTFVITVKGSQNIGQPTIPPVDGLTFNGPARAISP